MESDPEEDGRDKEEQEAEDDDTGDEGTMPTATPKRAAKPPKMAPKATPEAPKDGVEDADVADLALQVRNNLNLNTWYSIDCTQDFPIFACVFVDIVTQMICLCTH